MNDEQPIPPELLPLLEKRAGKERRRKSRRQVDVGPLGSLESAASPEEMVLEERRGQSDRRKQSRRRGGRRKSS